MMCQDFQTEILDGQKKEAATDASKALAEHLAQCADCRDLQRLMEGLNALPHPDPPEGLSQRFHQRLALELAATSKSHPFLGSWWMPLSAAALLLLSAGMSLGFLLRGGRDDSGMARLRRGSAADRMEAIALVNQQNSGPVEMVPALLDRIGHDPSLEVRLSAVEALYIFCSDPEISPRIELALSAQDRPEVQLALIDLVAALRQRRAAEALRRLIREGGLPAEVRQRAKQRLAQMSL